MKLNEFLMIKKAAEFMGVTENTLRNWEKSNKITVYRNKFNKYRLYKIEDLEKLKSEIVK